MGIRHRYADDLPGHRHVERIEMIFHPVHGVQPDAPQTQPKPQFHPVLGYISQEENDG